MNAATDTVKNKQSIMLARVTLAGQFLAYLFQQFRANQGTLNAAALTYTTLFAVVPLMTVTYTMVSSIPTFSDVGVQIEDMIFENFIPSSGMAVREHLSGFASQARTLTAVGVVFLVITAYMMIKTIEAAFNRIWRVEEQRQGISSFLLYWAVLSLGPLLLGLGFALTSYLASLPLISDATAYADKLSTLKIVPILTSTAAFTLLYAAVPNCQIPIKHAFCGGLVVALIFEGAKQGFTLFVTQFPSYQLIYGAFAAVPLFLAWIFISWVIVLIGAELVRAISYFHEDKAEHPARKSGWLLLLLEQAWLAQQQGSRVTAKSLKRTFPQLPATNRDRYIKQLVMLKLIEKTESGGYVLRRDLNRLSLWDILGELPWKLPKQLQLPESRSWLPAVNEYLAELHDTRVEQLRHPVAELFDGTLSSKKPLSSMMNEANQHG